MTTMVTILKIEKYKKHVIAKCHDCGDFVIVMGKPMIFASIADAKRAINGKETVYLIDDDKWAVEEYNEAAEAVTYKLLPL